MSTASVDAGHRAARLATALMLLATIGAIAHFSSTNELVQRNVKSATSTAGIIIVVAQVPLIGALPKSMAENLIGTFLGASMGMLVFFSWDRLVSASKSRDGQLRCTMQQQRPTFPLSLP